MNNNDVKVCIHALRKRGAAEGIGFYGGGMDGDPAYLEFTTLKVFLYRSEAGNGIGLFQMLMFRFWFCITLAHLPYTYIYICMFNCSFAIVVYSFLFGCMFFNLPWPYSHSLFSSLLITRSRLTSCLPFSVFGKKSILLSI